jgi:hypothetical protein
MVKKLNNEFEQKDEDEGGESGQAGSGIEFHFDLLTEEPRDDLLSPEELKRLLKVRNEWHYELVKKQKIERKTRNEIKEGKKPSFSNAYGNAGYGMESAFKSHPINQKAYFSGIDKKVIGIGSESLAKTNEGQKNELKQRLEPKKRLQHEHVPKFNPTPRPGQM